MTRGPVVFMALVLLLCACVFVFTAEHANAPSAGLKPEISQDEAVTLEQYKNRRMDINTYISTNIRDLSPVQETLGGAFYVTSVNAANGSGVVHYEDGHSQYVADFTYTTSEEGGYMITKFKVRK